MKKLILLIFISIGVLAVACHDVTVGYLSTENAGYAPDTLVVKQTLDVDSTLNPNWDRFYNIALNIWEDAGFNSPEECLEELFKITKYNYSEDYERWKLQIPWLSTKIQGVKGTQQIYVRIKDIKSSDGDAEAMSQQLTVRGDGMFKLPTDVSSIPVGRYQISLNIYNEGYSQDVDDVFTIIVK